LQRSEGTDHVIDDSSGDTNYLKAIFHGYESLTLKNKV
jgi:hypothetical protein